MERIQYVDIAGQSYPLNFSVRAAAAVTERYGDIMGINGALGLSGTQDGTPPDSVQIMMEMQWMLALLLKEGAAYVSLLHGETIQPPTQEALEVLLQPGDALRIRIAVLDTVNVGLSATVEVEPEPKNAETTQNS